MNIADEEEVVADDEETDSTEAASIQSGDLGGEEAEVEVEGEAEGVAGDRAAEAPVLENLWLRCTAWGL
jgi:hypothetical protein